MDAPRYGTLDLAYIATWFDRGDDDGPMWALNLMEYRDIAFYADGRQTDLTGQEADDLYAPLGPLAAIGARVLLLAPVVHQLVGDATTWHRVAIAQYPRRAALAEMNARPDFEELHAHKDAGMASTFVMATFPRNFDSAPDPAITGVGTDRLMLVQVVADPEAPDRADGIDAVRIGRFNVEGVMVGDGRCFAEARFDLIAHEAAEQLAAEDPVTDDPRSYVLVVDPQIDSVAGSLADTSVVRP